MFFIRIWVFALVAVFFMGCGQRQAAELKIVNGEVIPSNEWPAVVRVSVSGTQAQQCTGTFVNERQLLTAAHCVLGTQPNEISVLTSGERLEVLSYVTHPKFSKQDNNGVNGFDLAVLNFAKYVSSHFVSLLQRQPAVGDQVEVVGFGVTDNLTLVGAGPKRKGQNTLVSAKALLGMVGPASTTNAKGENASTGKGDSGGPVFIDGVLAGVVSGAGTMGDFSFSASVNLRSSSSQDFLQRHLFTEKDPS